MEMVYTHISTHMQHAHCIYPHCLCTVYTPEMKFHIILGLRFQNCALCSQSQNIVRLGPGKYLYDYRFIIIIITLGWCGRDSLVYCGGVTIPTIRHIWAGPATTPSQHTSAVKRSIGSTTGFHNHREGPYLGLLLVESAY